MPDRMNEHWRGWSSLGMTLYYGTVFGVGVFGLAHGVGERTFEDGIWVVSGAILALIGGFGSVVGAEWLLTGRDPTDGERSDA